MSRLDYKRKKLKEIERRERGESAFVSFVKAHAGLLVLAVIVLLVGAAAIVIGTNPNFGTRFSGNNNTSLYLDQNTIFEMPYTAQEKTVTKAMGSSVIICGKDKLISLSDAGKTQWEIPVSLNTPILSVCGEYILAADKGGRDIYLINGGKVILQTMSQHSIINAKASSDGKFVIVSEEPYFKGLVTVKDAKNNEVFVWHSGGAYIIDAVIGADTDKLALAVVNTSVLTDEKAVSSVSSGVLMFNLYDSEPYKTHTFEGCLVTNVFRADKGFVAVTDKKTVAIGADGELGKEFSYDAKSLGKIYKSDTMLVLSLEDGGGRKSIAALDNKGHEKCNIDVKQMPNFISADSDRIAYGGGSEITVCDNAGGELYLVQTAKKYDSLMLLAGAKRAVGVTSASINILEIK